MSKPQETHYSVQRMKCGGCIAKATAALSGLPGYISAEFDLKSASVVVQGNVDPQAVVDALNKVGYPTQTINDV